EHFESASPRGRAVVVSAVEQLSRLESDRGNVALQIQTSHAPRAKKALHGPFARGRGLARRS
ncbi:MAG: hypothetical protein ACR2PH_09800, partial [Desulfobulbia bacterium]